MVKGTSKRVIVVKSPDPRFFEQAIFIVKDEALRQGAGEHSRILSQAQQVADDYINSCIAPQHRRSPIAAYAAFCGAGAAAVAIVCLVLFLTGIL